MEAAKIVKRPPTVRAVKNSGYSEGGASYSKNALKGMIPNSRAPWEDIDDNNYTLRQRSRMLYMASPVAAKRIERM